VVILDHGWRCHHTSWRRRRSQRQSAGHMDGAIYYQYEAHDHRGSDARNHLHVPGPRVRPLGVHELEWCGQAHGHLDREPAPLCGGAGF